MILNRAFLYMTLFAALLSIGNSPAASIVPEFEVIAKSGDPVEGTTFQGFGETSLMADAPVVAVIATFHGPLFQGIWESADRQILVKTGDAVSVAEKTWTIGRLDAMRLDPSGNVQFLADIRDSAHIGQRAFFASPHLPPVLIEREPVRADIASRFFPDHPEPPALVCEKISGFSANINETRWLVSGTFSGGGLAHHDAIFGETGPLLRAGTAMPEFPEETLSGFSMAFMDPAPGGAAVFTLVPSIITGIWQVDLTGTPYLRFLLNDSPKNEPPGATINNPWGPAANWHHTTVFTAMVVSGYSSGHSVLWVSAGSELLTLARQGEPAPDGNGAVFFTFRSPAPGSNRPGSNKGCRAVFVANLEGSGVAPSNDVGLYVAGNDGSLHKILREGDLFSVSKNDQRTVAAFTFTPWSLNGLDQVSLSIDFTDGSSALVITRLTGTQTSPTPTPTPTPETAPLVITHPEGRRIVTSRPRITLHGSAEGDVTAVEWKLKRHQRVRDALGGTRWRVPLQLRRSREVIFVRAVSSNGERSAWKRIVVLRR